VCDRTSDRLQVFTREGKFVQEIMVMPDSLGDGSTWDTAFSRDPQQRFLYVADGRNQKLHIYDRKTLTELTSFGEGGHYPGQFYSMHSIATDSKGNLYTTETYQGRRVQRFLFKGIGPVTKKDQGVPWPTSGQ
jgi:sugar lactone lactonase YvrE